MIRRRGSVLREMLVAPLRTATTLALLGTAAVTLATQRPFAAYLCPSCFGLEHVAPGLYVDEPAVTRRMLTMVAAAQRRVERALGPVDTRTVFLVCSREACEERIPGAPGDARARAVTYGWAFVRVSPEGLSEAVLAHELVHVAAHRQIGFAALALERLPIWWDEGLAVIVAQGRPRGCPSETGGLPEASAEWRREAGQGSGTLYLLAACQTAAWLDRNGGLPGAMAMLDALRQGKPFPP